MFFDFYKNCIFEISMFSVKFLGLKETIDCLATANYMVWACVEEG